MIIALIVCNVIFSTLSLPILVYASPNLSDWRFEAHFETGDLSEVGGYPGYVDYGGRKDVVDWRANTGNYSVRLQCAGFGRSRLGLDWGDWRRPRIVNMSAYVNVAEWDGYIEFLELSGNFPNGTYTLGPMVVIANNYIRLSSQWDSDMSDRSEITNASVTFNLNTWYNVRLEASLTASGYYRVYLDDVLCIDDSGIDLSNCIPFSVNYCGVILCESTADYYDLYVDDFVVAGTTSANPTTDDVPTYDQADVNATDVGQPINFHLRAKDDEGLLGYTFWTNNTGVGANDTFVSLASQEDIIFGKYDDQGQYTEDISANNKTVTRFEAVDDMNVSTLSVYLSNQTSGVASKGLIYSDSGGNPDALLAESDEVMVDDEGYWNYTFSPAVALTNGTSYHFGVIVNGTTRCYFDNGRTNQTAFLADTYSDNASDPFGTPSNQSKWHGSMFITGSQSDGRMVYPYVSDIDVAKTLNASTNNVEYKFYLLDTAGQWTETTTYNVQTEYNITEGFEDDLEILEDGYTGCDGYGGYGRVSNSSDAFSGETSLSVNGTSWGAMGIIDVAPQNNTYIRFYVKLGSISSDLPIMELYTDNAAQEMLRLHVETNSTHYRTKMYVRYVGWSGWQSGDWTAGAMSVDAWQCVELHWRRSIGSGTYVLAQTYVNGTLNKNVTSSWADWYGNLNEVVFGSSETGSTTNLYDDFVLSESYIGETIYYYLTVSSGAGGSTNPSTGVHAYVAGENATVNATASGGYEFANWTLDGGDGGTDNPLNVTMNANHTLVANFNQLVYYLNITSSVGGTTDPTVGVHSYFSGTNASVTASASEGYTFANWTLDGGDGGTDNPLNVTMNANHTLTANFDEIPIYYLTIGSGTGGSCNLTIGEHPYYTGDTVYVEATANTSYLFSFWILDGGNGGTSNPITVSMTQNYTLTPAFIYQTDSLFYVPSSRRTFDTESWYFRNDTWTVNGELGYKLYTIQSDESTYVESTSASLEDFTVSMNIKVVEEDGTATYLARNVAQVTQSGLTAGTLKNTTYTHYQQIHTSYADAIQIEILFTIGGGELTTKATFITHALMTELINNNTWTINYYLAITNQSGTYHYYFCYGHSDCDSKIVNIQYASLDPWGRSLFYLNESDLIGFLLNPYSYYIGQELALGLIAMAIIIPAYNRYRDVRPVMVLCLLFGGVGGVLTALIPAVAMKISFLFLAIGLAIMLYKLIR